MYEVLLMKKAQRFYADAQPPLARKLARCFQQLEQNPRAQSGVKALTGELGGYLRYRVGDYRVLYRIDDKKRIVSVEKIAHRSEAYS
jgi:mRNA interferase RelE/StbE